MVVCMGYIDFLIDCTMKNSKHDGLHSVLKNQKNSEAEK